MHTIKLISWNVNGIRAVHRKGAFDYLLETKPDIACIQETKAHPEQLEPPLNQLDGYHVYFSSAERKGYSGVALYSKFAPLKVETGFGIDKFDSEGRTLIAEYNDFILFNIYFPNGKQSKERLQYKMDFYDTFLNYVKPLKDAGKHLVICGDVNTAHKEIDLSHPKANEKTSGFLPEEREWIDKLLAAGFIDALREYHQEPELYTWWDVRTGARARNIGWRIDYFYISDHTRDRLNNAAIHPEVMGSDHCPISIELETTVQG
ncbi:exodeoxyribonuclease III [candidate division KSB1 bacterium]|nr:exodeoxyribonuclease III [candidate division KSB1 bacterium]